MTAFTLPQLSISMEEGIVLAWLVADGAEVRAGEPVVEVETDKATLEVEAPVSGRLRIVAATGASVPVDGLLAEIEEAGAVPATGPAVEGSPPVMASPAARRLARERGVDLEALAASGPRGEVVFADVIRAAQESRTVPAAAAGDVRVAVLATIAASWREIPHIHIVGELVADGLAEARRAAADAPGPRLTVTDLLAAAVARALADVPDLNGTVRVDGTAARSAEVHLGLAVATPQGVVAPVLRDAGRLPLADLARERARLVEVARGSRLEKRDLGGGTCTLSNLGAYPVDLFVPVISGPQIALVAVGRLAERPVAVDGMVGVRPRLWVNVAIDQRGADGEAGGRFLAALEERLAELPSRLGDLRRPVKERST